MLLHHQASKGMKGEAGKVCSPPPPPFFLFLSAPISPAEWPSPPMASPLPPPGIRFTVQLVWRVRSLSTGMWAVIIAQGSSDSGRCNAVLEYSSICNWGRKKVLPQNESRTKINLCTKQIASVAGNAVSYIVVSILGFPPNKLFLELWRKICTSSFFRVNCDSNKRLGTWITRL